MTGREGADGDHTATMLYPFSGPARHVLTSLTAFGITAEPDHLALTDRTPEASEGHSHRLGVGTEAERVTSL